MAPQETATMPTATSDLQDTMVARVQHDEPPRVAKKVAFITGGTLGDIQPASHLCHELDRRGYQTIFMSPPRFKYLVDSNPSVTYVEGGMGIEDASETDAGRQFTQSSALNMRKRGKEYMATLIRDLVPRAMKLIETEKPDIVILTIVSYLNIAPILEALKVPHVSLLVNPFHATGEHTGTFDTIVPHSFGVRAINLIEWQFNYALSGAVVIGGARKAWNDLELPANLKPKQVKWSYYHSSPKIVAASTVLFPAPKDWNPRVAVVTGAIPNPVDLSAYSNPEVSAFIARHQRVAYVGYGSMLLLYRDPQKRQDLLQASVGACMDHGLAVVVSTNGIDEGYFQNPNPDMVLEVRSMPHAWLFPQCALVMHHGGSGTTHTGLAAGAPQVIVPFRYPHWFHNILEQHFWSARLSKLGIGYGLGFKKFSRARMSRLVEKATRPEAVRRAQELKKAYEGERNGLFTSADVVEDLLKADLWAKGVQLPAPRRQRNKWDL